MPAFNGLGMNLGSLARLSRAKTRSLSPENFTGEKGQGGMATKGTGANCARDLGQGWKIPPLCASLPARPSSWAMSRAPAPSSISG